MTQELNKVDVHVKQLMLGFPSSYPNRMSVLASELLNPGGGYYWNALGELDCHYPSSKSTATKMDMRDANAELKTAKTELQGALGTSGEALAQRRLADAQLECIQRRHRAQNIDAYVQKYELAEPTHADLLHHLDTLYTLDNTVLGHVSDVPHLHLDWAYAVEEVVTACLARLDDQEYGGATKRTKALREELTATLEAARRIIPEVSLPEDVRQQLSALLELAGGRSPEPESKKETMSQSPGQAVEVRGRVRFEAFAYAKSRAAFSEIASKPLRPYWERVKDQLAAFGFKDCATVETTECEVQEDDRYKVYVFVDLVGVTSLPEDTEPPEELRQLLAVLAESNCFNGAGERVLSPEDWLFMGLHGFEDEQAAYGY